MVRSWIGPAWFCATVKRSLWHHVALLIMHGNQEYSAKQWFQIISIIFTGWRCHMKWLTNFASEEIDLAGSNGANVGNPNLGLEIYAFLEVSKSRTSLSHIHKGFLNPLQFNIRSLDFVWYLVHLRETTATHFLPIESKGPLFSVLHILEQIKCIFQLLDDFLNKIFKCRRAKKICLSV